tara:strand:- start:956 stop:1408 length:453 start_codon:yes stop_codon:yes gene_type:complete
MNNGKYNTKQYKALQEEKNDRRFGPIASHTKNCKCCNAEFVYEGRIKTKAYERANFCSRSCSNNRQAWWNTNATGYRTIAFQTWKKECAICGFNKVVAVHHIDENHNNNDPKNLIPLCPNHHEMVHSKWKKEVNELIGELVKWDHATLAR